MKVKELKQLLENFADDSDVYALRHEQNEYLIRADDLPEYEVSLEGPVKLFIVKGNKIYDLSTPHYIIMK